MDKQIQEAIEKQYRESYERIIERRRKRKNRENKIHHLWFMLYMMIWAEIMFYGIFINL